MHDSVRCALVALLTAPAALLAQSPSAGGVITTQQRITPAGVQTVFNGRVRGVIFGKGAARNEVWAIVAANGEDSSGVWQLDWRNNRTLGVSRFRGTPGMQGIRLDVEHHRSASLLAYVGDRGVRLAHVEDNSLAPVSEILGRMSVGALAVALRENARRQRIAVVPLTYNDSVAVVDVASGVVLRKVATGIAPFAAVLDSNATVAYVSNWGGRHAKHGDLTAPSSAETRDTVSVVVNARGVNSTATVTRIDLATGRVTDAIAVALHPTALVWDEPRQRLYAAAGNGDAVSVIDTRANSVAATFTIAPFRDRAPGVAPTALALAPDGRTLYAALGGINAVAVLDAATGRLRGLIPTAWYPSSIAVSEDGATLAVGALLGIGSGTATTELASAYPHDFVAGKGYVHAVRGTVDIIPVPIDARLAEYSAAVAGNLGLPLGAGSGSFVRPVRPRVAPRAVPERPGEPSSIQHVVYIIKENRTYDQVFGDVPKGNGDPSLAIYGDSVTPNHHRLATQFVLLDNFFATGGNSNDGHQWATQANETDYVMWGAPRGGNPSEGTDPLAPAAAGFLWDAALAAGKTVQVFGEYAGRINPTEGDERRRNLAAWRRGQDFRGRFHAVTPIKQLDAILAHEFPGYGGNVPDVVRAQLFLHHLDEWERQGKMPNLVIMDLPSDHTGGTLPGYATPAACLADNDLALGQVVERLTHSRFWQSMAIMVMEDDAQGGVDHVDGHRTVALAISPYTRRGALDHTMYAQQSMVKTVELMLGLNPMSVFDLTAPSMSASFLSPAERPDLSPYQSVEPRQPIEEFNPRISELRGPARRAALASARMNFADPDEAPSETLNRILWHAAKGWERPYPAVRHSLFFPMAVDVDDNERPARR